VGTRGTLRTRSGSSWRYGIPDAKSDTGSSMGKRCAYFFKAKRSAGTTRSTRSNISSSSSTWISDSGRPGAGSKSAAYFAYRQNVGTAPSPKTKLSQSGRGSYVKATRTKFSWRKGGADKAPSQRDFLKPKRQRKPYPPDPICARSGCGYKRSTHFVNPEWLPEPHDFID
jgi:hypothetical protein